MKRYYYSEETKRDHASLYIDEDGMISYYIDFGYGFELTNGMHVSEEGFNEITEAEAFSLFI
jgi:hypothetical protein